MAGIAVLRHQLVSSPGGTPGHAGAMALALVGLACGAGVVLPSRCFPGWRGAVAAVGGGVAAAIGSLWPRGGAAGLAGMALVGAAGGLLLLAERRRARLAPVAPLVVAVAEFAALSPAGKAISAVPVALVAALLAAAAAFLPARQRASAPGRGWASALLLRYPSVALGLLPIVRAPASRLAAEAALLGSVLLGGGLLVGGDTAGGAVAAGSLGLLSAAIAEGAGSAATLGELLLPVAGGYLARRASIPVAAVAAVAFGLSLALAGTVPMVEAVAVAAGLGVAVAGIGASLLAIATGWEEAAARPIAGVAAAALPLLAMAPFVQINNAGSGPFAVAYAIAGASFSLLVGLSGVAIARWWRGV